MLPFITSKNKPMVKMVIGKVNKINTGLTRVLSADKKNAITQAKRKSSIFTPGRIYVANNIARPLKLTFIIQFLKSIKIKVQNE